MPKLNKDNFTDVVAMLLKKTCQISPDKESKEAGIHKTVHLEMDYTGLSFQDVMAKCLKSDVIAWQNGANGRKAYDKHVDGAVIKVKATSPGAGYIDPEIAYEAKFESATAEDQQAMIDSLMAKMNK